jgi:hypothetical protein
MKLFSLTDLRHPITTVHLRETIGSSDRIDGRSVNRLLESLNCRSDDRVS